jgi:ribosome-binding factor A
LKLSKSRKSRARCDARDVIVHVPRRKPKTDKSADGPSQRQLRAGELVRHALIEVLAEGHFRDPDLVDVSITVAEVRMSPDLRHAFAFVMPLGGREAERVLAALKRARVYIRAEIAKRVKLQFATEIHFELDRSFDEGAKIEALLRSPLVKRDTDSA